MAILHVTNGDAVVPEIAAAMELTPDDVLVWREILHDGPVPADLAPDALARVRARHLAARSWTHGNGAEPSAGRTREAERSAGPTREAERSAGPTREAERSASPTREAEPSASPTREAEPSAGAPQATSAEPTEATALAMFRERDARLAAHPADAEVALWFEDDLFDALLQAQVEDRLAGRPGPVTRVPLRHPPRGDLRAAFEARRPIDPDPAAFAALRSPDPRAWLDIRAFERLLEELPNVRTGLTRIEREILEALRDGPLPPERLFLAVAEHEDPPWLGDATVFALAADLDPLVAHTDGTYELMSDGEAVLAGTATRPPIDRWLGGVHLGPGHADWAWDPAARRPVRLD